MYKTVHENADVTSWKRGYTHVGETLGEIESHQHGVALGDTVGLLVICLDTW